MSIAITATVVPSRFLAGMLVFMFSLANLGIGYAGFSLGIKPFYIFLIVMVCVSLSAYKLLRFYRRQHAIRLDISNSGDIIFRSLASNSFGSESIAMRLSEGSTLWPQLMVLSLRSHDGNVVVVPILRDCVDPGTFRKLSVALNWIAMKSSSNTGLDSDITSGNF
jgi:hypothetical protein